MLVDAGYLPDWVTNLGGSRSGGATVSVTVNSNTSTVPRTGTVSVQGQVFTISQAGADATCSYRVSPTVFSFSDRGGAGEVRVTTGTGCAWLVGSNQTWLEPAVTDGTSTATFSFTAKPNSGTTGRIGKLTVGPWAVTVFQSGRPRRTKYDDAHGREHRVGRDSRAILRATSPNSTFGALDKGLPPP